MILLLILWLAFAVVALALLAQRWFYDWQWRKACREEADEHYLQQALDERRARQEQVSEEELKRADDIMMKSDY